MLICRRCRFFSPCPLCGSWLGYLTGGEDYYSHSTGVGGTKVLDMREQARPHCGANCSTVRFDLVGNYSTHVFTQRAVDIVRAHDPSSRLYLYLAYQVRGRLPHVFAYHFCVGWAVQKKSLTCQTCAFL